MGIQDYILEVLTVTNEEIIKAEKKKHSGVTGDNPSPNLVSPKV